MENLIFALNATIPLFIMIALGYFLKKINILSDGFLKSANTFNFKVTLPVLLFTDLATTDFKSTFDLKFFLFCAIATTITFVGIWMFGRIFIKKNINDIGEFVQASYRSSAAVMGIALIQNLYGDASIGGMMVLGCVPLYNIFAVIILEKYSPDNTKSNAGLGKTLLSIAKNPIIIGVVAGLVSSLIGIEYPVIIDSSLNFVARCATPLALICIGGAFNLKNALKSAKLSVLAACIKIVIIPIIFTIAAILLGFQQEKLVGIFVMLAAPTTPSTFIMAKQFGYDGTITSSSVVLTTLFSSITMTIFVYTLRTMGYI